MTSKPRKSTQTKGTRLAREIRAKCNKLTPAQRAHYHKVGLNLIARGSELDAVLASQLRAMRCTFTTKLSPHYGLLLHIGPPDTFWCQQERLLLTVRAFYPLATFALSDAEGCTSLALFGSEPRTVVKATKRGRK